MIDNNEIENILNILENLEDEKLAVKLLADFNHQSKVLGVLIKNLDPSLSHVDWKKKCDEEQNKLNKIVETIKSL